MTLFAGLRRFPIWPGLAGALVLLATVPALAATDGSDWMRERYTTLEPKLRAAAFGAPVYVESEDRDGIIRGEVYGVLSHSFAVFSATLQQLPIWCELATLHFNVKGCTYRSEPQPGVLTIYNGGKHYENPKDAHQQEFIFTVQAAPDYFHILMASDDGPLDTYENQLEISAIPLADRTFVCVRFSYRYRLFTRMLSAAYFASVGRNKIGFSVVKTDEAGNPIYVKGRNGAVERNVMRYYLGLQALLESLARPESERFEWRLRRWYALTDRYRRQLYELDEEEYLNAKRQERVGWLHLQAELDRKP